MSPTEASAVRAEERGELQRLLDDHAADTTRGLVDLQARIRELEQLAESADLERQRLHAWICWSVAAPTTQEARARMCCALAVNVWPPGFGPVRRG